MKKIYSTPNTALLHLNIGSQILAGSSVINTTSMTQDLGEAGVLDAEDTGGDNLGKDNGTNLWDAWDE
jgi:hypothetical protein